ncbi:hypothetical protein J3R83DRAFT_4611 [Lanmaoa asiatica]|nr:hypothetical protein J3R83DRAFT_4611 [Lanmaoa asiatica]
MHSKNALPSFTHRHNLPGIPTLSVAMDIAGSPKQSPTPANSISFCPAPHAAEPFGTDVGLRVNSGEDPSLALLRAVAPQRGRLCSELLYTSLPTKSDAMRDVLPQGNGFVHTVIEAYNRHRVLIIRPDDVWLAILTQFCFFVNSNAEALRSTFVAYEGKRELVITALGNRYAMDPASMARQMTELMQEHIIDVSLREWIMPSFTTTTEVDRSISAIVMMGTMKEYFSYGFCLCCGIPRVTLEGEKSDWEEVLRRLEGLKKYGVETNAWYHLLRPIISRFVTAYDDPTSAENLDFWSKVAHRSGGGSGPTWLSGWITAFCVFNEQGQWQGNKFTEEQHEGIEKVNDPLQLSADGFAPVYIRSEVAPYLTLDGFPYPTIDCDAIPCGYTYVDVKLDDNGELLDTMFVAGTIGSQICSVKAKLFSNGTRNTVQPLPAWWYFIKGKEPEAKYDMNTTVTTDNWFPVPPPRLTNETNGDRRSRGVMSRMKSALDTLRRN